MKRARKVNPALAQSPAIRKMAGPIFYNGGACARPRQSGGSGVRAFREAVEHGFNDFAQMDRDADLKTVRAPGRLCRIPGQGQDILRRARHGGRGDFCPEQTV